MADRDTRKRLKRITAMLPPGAAPPGDRRDTDRTACTVSCSCSPITLNQRPPFWPAKVRDVSPIGIGLVISRALAPGTFLAIHISPQFGGPLRARVIHTTPRLDLQGWVVGCTLSRALSPDELRALTY